MEEREQRDTQGLNLRFSLEEYLKQLFLKLEDAGNEGACAKHVFLTLMEDSIVKLKQLQFRDSTTARWPESGLVIRSVVRPIKSWGRADYICLLTTGTFPTGGRWS